MYDLCNKVLNLFFCIWTISFQRDCLTYMASSKLRETVWDSKIQNHDLMEKKTSYWIGLFTDHIFVRKKNLFFVNFLYGLHCSTSHCSFPNLQVQVLKTIFWNNICCTISLIALHCIIMSQIFKILFQSGDSTFVSWAVISVKYFQNWKIKKLYIYSKC